ncbi:hypothetical protein [Lysobacter capsici]|uniref:hypothetical protein n=1 Tax=Lysobacter capsici TaxID=435897 RepID=UPI001BFFF615|nr:hypothetical protein [Lysobacter capsici]QWF15638.1 hypothetical protein KME82_17860 [Lysobacter capsici]
MLNSGPVRFDPARIDALPDRSARALSPRGLVLDERPGFSRAPTSAIIDNRIDRYLDRAAPGCAPRGVERS